MNIIIFVDAVNLTEMCNLLTKCIGVYIYYLSLIKLKNSFHYHVYT